MRLFHTRRATRLAAALPLLLVLGCNEFTDIGQDVTDDVDVRFTEVPVVQMVTDRSQPLFTDVFSPDLNSAGSVIGTGATSNTVGQLTDPILGTIRAESYLAFAGSFSSAPVYGFDVRLDSVVLELTFSSRYGTVNTPLQFEVHELADTLRLPEEVDPLFRSDTVVNVTGPNLIAGAAPVSFDPVSLSRRVRFRLPVNLGQEVLDANPSLLVDSNARRFTGEVFPGVRIRATATANPGVLYNFSSGGATITIFYRSRQAASATLTSARLVLRPTLQRYTRIEHSNEAMTLTDSVRNPATDDNIRAYLRGLTNANIRLRLPNLNSLVPQSLVNAASMTLFVDPQSFGSDSLFFPPSTLNLFLADESDTLKPDFDFFVAQGRYNVQQQAYEFNIRSGLQYLLGDASRDLPFILLPADRRFNPTRVVLATPRHPNLALRPQVRLFYTPPPSQ